MIPGDGGGRQPLRQAPSPQSRPLGPDINGEKSARDTRQIPQLAMDEIFLDRNVTAKIEYLFVDLPNGACTSVGNCGGAAGSIVSFKENIIRAGLNFKFGPWW